MIAGGDASFWASAIVCGDTGWGGFPDGAYAPIFYSELFAPSLNPGL
jgi:hypothetical protein